MRHRRQRRQRADPVRDGDAVQEHRIGRVSHCGERRRGMPAGRQRQPDAHHAQARSTPGRSGCSGFSRRNEAIGHHGDRDQQRRPKAGGKRALPWRRCHDAPSGRLSRSRPCRPSEADRADETDGERAAADLRPARALPDPGREERAADADEQAEIDPDPRQPDQHRQRTCLHRRGDSRSRRRSKTPAIPPRDARPARPRGS